MRFPGQYYTSETAINGNGFRTYDPTTGRYIESDPIGLAGGINTYGYAEANPLSHGDRLCLDSRPRAPNPLEPYEGYRNIRKGIALCELGSGIDLTVWGAPVGVLVQGLGGLYILGGAGQIVIFSKEVYEFGKKWLRSEA